MPECFMCGDGDKPSPEEFEKRLAEMKELEAEMIKKYGFYTHFVYPHEEDAEIEGTVNIHTHGLSEIGMSDLQMTIPLPEDVVNSILHTIVALMRNKTQVYDGVILENVVKDNKIKLIAARENRRNVLRIILPDPEGNIEYKGMAYPFNKQYANLDTE